MSVVNSKLFKWIVSILLLISIFVNIGFFKFIDVLQGDSRIINYSGIIRGASQRLVKQELAHNPNNKLIEEIGSIISELRGGNGNNNLKTMNDPKFQEALLKLEPAWEELIEEIYRYRLGAEPHRLYQLSEEYFELANDLVFSAQKYSELKMDRILFFKPMLLVSVSLILLIYLYLFVSMLHLKYSNKKLSELVYVDILTNLPNRTHYNEIIAKYQQMESLLNLVCIYFDLNNLKKTNDTLGHDAGDKLIQAFSQILKETSENYGFVCRNGGDEFVAIFENCSREKVDNYMKIINKKIDIYNKKETVIKIGFASGIAFSDEADINNINDILTLADKRMYKNKEKSKYLMNKMHLMIL